MWSPTNAPSAGGDDHERRVRLAVRRREHARGDDEGLARDDREERVERGEGEEGEVDPRRAHRAFDEVHDRVGHRGQGGDAAARRKGWRQCGGGCGVPHPRSRRRGYSRAMSLSRREFAGAPCRPRRPVAARCAAPVSPGLAFPARLTARQLRRCAPRCAAGSSRPGTPATTARAALQPALRRDQPARRGAAWRARRTSGASSSGRTGSTSSSSARRAATPTTAARRASSAVVVDMGGLDGIAIAGRPSPPGRACR